MGFTVVIAFGVVIYVLFKKDFTKEKTFDASAFLPVWRLVLIEHVAFYNSLNTNEKTRFESNILDFLSEVRVTGIDVKIEDKDRILVAASAIIPIFAFPEWKYKTIDEVLLYPDSFNERFETKGPGRNILGMVGDGHLNGTMILSRPALLHGFLNETDKRNTAIHEFVHLIDKEDGAIDGIPEVLMHKKYAIPWMELITYKIEEINNGKSDINPYGGTSHIEFLAVVSEYFFERPHLLKSKHPELYEMMEQMFQQEMSAKTLERKKNRIGRNDPCPCSKGKKFKNCCGAVYYS